MMDTMSQWLENSSFPILSAFILGLMTAIAPCPLATNISATAYIARHISDNSGALFFSMLVPMTMQESGGLFMPVVFALGTGIPVILLTYLIVFSVERVGAYFKALQRVEKWMRYAAGGVFVLAGLYYVNVFLKII